MVMTAAQVWDAAKALPRNERAVAAQDLLATLGATDVRDEVRTAVLRVAVDAGINSFDAGEGVPVPVGSLREYLRERGWLATARARTATA